MNIVKRSKNNKSKWGNYTRLGNMLKIEEIFQKNRYNLYRFYRVSIATTQSQIHKDGNLALITLAKFLNTN